MSSLQSSTHFERHLKGWCEKGGHSENAFAKLLGVDPSTLSRIKTAQTRTDTATLALACREFGLDRRAAAILYEEAGHKLAEVLTAA